MRLVLAEDFFELFPDATIAAVLARGIDNGSTETPEEADARAASLREAQAEVVRKLADGPPVTEMPRIRCWREAYRAFGAKPKDYPSSIENLVRRTLKGGTLRPINRLVDLYNVVSLEHLLPAGGEDLDAIVSDIVLTRASDNEPEVLLLGEKEPRAPKTGEVIYKDDLGAICRRWNWKEADRTKLTPSTRNAVLVLEALPPIEAEELEIAASDLARRVEQACGGVVRVERLDRARPAMTLS